MKKILSYLLILTMLFSYSVINVFSAESVDDADENDTEIEEFDEDLDFIPVDVPTPTPVVIIDENRQNNTCVIYASEAKINKNYKVMKKALGLQNGYLYASSNNLAINIPKETVPDAEVNFSVDYNDEFILWIRVQSDSTNSDTGFIAVDNDAYKPLYAKPSVNWSFYKYSLGVIEKGEHKIKLVAKKSGQKIERFLVTNDETYNPNDSLKNILPPSPSPTPAPTVYLQEKQNIANLKIYEPEQQIPGTFMMEAEDGTIVKPMNINEDPTASGGKYIAATIGSKKLNSAEQVQAVHARYKLKITEKGRYFIWIRMITPSPKSKSSWYGVDREPYSQLSTTTIPNWTWRRLMAANFDVGYHTFNYKYREAGQQIDKIIVTNQESFTPTGMGSLPGEAEIASVETEAQKAIVKGYYNDNKLTFDANPKKDGSVILTPVRLIMFSMGIEFLDYDDYCLIKKDRDYIKIKIGDRYAIANGKTLDLKKPVIREVDVSVMANVEPIVDFFGGKYRYDESVNSVYVDYVPEPEGFRQANESEISFDGKGLAFTWEMPYPDENANVISWVRKKGDLFWKKGYAPTYKDGSFHGSCAGLRQNTNYEVKVQVIDSKNNVDTFVSEYRLTGIPIASTMEGFAYEADSLFLVPTFENIGYYLDVASSKFTCDVSYREKGSGLWLPAYDPFLDVPYKQFRGSIVNLRENTTYEVRAVVKNGNTKVSEDIAEVTTFADNPPVGKTIPISEIYRGGTLVFENVSGSPDAWIKIVGDGKTEIFADKNIEDAVYVSNSRYIIFEDLIVKGGMKNAFYIVNKSHDIRVVNCDISEWGRVGIPDEIEPRYKDFDGALLNNDAGVRISEVKNVVVERCYMHDPNGRSNSWNGPTWNQIHPAGPNPIFIRGDGGVVIRYNDFIGSDEKRWNDGIESYYNGERSGGPSKDADVYGNIFAFGADDSTEFDGGQMNCRFYDNRIEGFLCGFSTAPILAGPTYIFRNLVANLGDETGKLSGSVIKNGGGGTYTYGREYIFNNTFDTQTKGINAVGYSSAPDRSRFLAHTRNNILVSTRAADGWVINDPYLQEDNSFDYDLIGNHGIDGGAGILVVREGEEANGIFGLPTYLDKEGGDFRLAKGSLGFEKGQYLPNFSKSDKPSMGAFSENDMGYFKPARPVDMQADKYTLNLTPAFPTATVTFTVGDVEPQRFDLRKNSAFDWIDLKLEDGTTSGTIEPNTSYTVTVTVDPTKIDYMKGNGGFTFRLKNGFSVPVLVYSTKQ